MLDEEYRDEESIRAILNELSTEPQPTKDPTPIPTLSKDNLGDFIMQQTAEVVAQTSKITEALQREVVSMPDNNELLSSVATIYQTQLKALDNLTKIHLNNEKLQQAKELEIFKQDNKLKIAQTQKGLPMTREDLMKTIYRNAKVVDAEMVKPELIENKEEKEEKD